MSRYTSVTDADRREMLAAIGVDSVDALFAEIPEGVRLGRPLDLPAGKAEQEVYEHLASLADDELLRKIGQGCADCFGILFHRYCRQVFSVSYRILRDKSETEDILQEVFLSIYLQQEKYDPARGSPKPFAIARIDESSCIGCTLCIQACAVDAIVGAAKLMHTVLAERCTGCELCLPPGSRYARANDPVLLGLDPHRELSPAKHG